MNTGKWANYFCACPRKISVWGKCLPERSSWGCPSDISRECLYYLDWSSWPLPNSPSLSLALINMEGCKTQGPFPQRQAPWPLSSKYTLFISCLVCPMCSPFCSVHRWSWYYSGTPNSMNQGNREQCQGLFRPLGVQAQSSEPVQSPEIIQK